MIRALALLLCLAAVPLAQSQGVSISLSTSGVTAGPYSNPQLTVDAFGRITSAQNGIPGLSAGAPASPNPRLTSQGYAATSSDPFVNLPCNAIHSPSVGDLWCNASGVFYFGGVQVVTKDASGGLTLSVPGGVIPLGCDALDRSDKGCYIHAGQEWNLLAQNALNTVEWSYWGEDHYGALQSLTPPPQPAYSGAYGHYYHNAANGGVAVKLDSVQLVSESRSCTSSNAGVIDYVAGAAGVKDTAQICAKDASNAYAWRAIY